MKATITISDNPNGTLDIEPHCSPPMNQKNPTKAGSIALLCLRTIKGASSGMKSMDVVTKPLKDES